MQKYNKKANVKLFPSDFCIILLVKILFGRHSGLSVSFTQNMR